MKNYKAIIVDDEDRGRSLLSKTLKKNNPNIEIIAIANDAISAIKQINEHKPDLAFLDINLGSTTAFEMLSCFPKIEFEIIFVTAHNDYIKRAFEFSAVDYILKPIDDEMLSKAIQLASGRIENKQEKQNVHTLLHNVNHTGKISSLKLCLTSTKGFKVVDLAEIIYCQAEGSYSVFHFVDGSTIVNTKSFSEWEPMLIELNFCRIHKSFIINMDHIKEYHRGEGGVVVMENNFEIDVSRRRKDSFIMKMKELFKF